MDLLDKLGVWDVETGAFIVEPGTYRIKAAKSSADPGSQATLTVTAGNGTPAAARNLNRQVLAVNFDDYSDIGGRLQDIELVSASPAYHSNTAVSFRHEGAWIVFKNVSVPAGTAALTVRTGSDRTGALNVYAVPPGTSPQNLRSPAVSFALTDTRPVAGLPTGLGIGPIAVTGQPYGNSPYPGSPVGQNGLYAHGQPYKDAYIKPDWHSRSAPVSVAPGSYDIYVLTEKRGARLEWLKFGSAPDTTSQLAISQPSLLSSIRAKGGTLPLTAELTPATSMSTVTWAVSGTDGAPTSLATIDASTGLLIATGQGNGTVRVTYKNVAFGARAPREFGIRLAPEASAVTTATVQVWADAAGSGGTLLGTVTAATSGSSVTYATYVTAITATITGVHHIVLRPSAAVRVNWLAFG